MNGRVDLDEATRAALYNRGYQAVMKALADEHHGLASAPLVQQWPANYDLARVANGDVVALANGAPCGNKYITRQVPREFVRQFGERLLAKLAREDPERFAGAFFLHEIAGTKSGHMHGPDDAYERQEKLEDMLLDFADNLPPKTWLYDPLAAEAAQPTTMGEFREQWWVDVALTFSVKNAVVNWSASGRNTVLNMSYPHYEGERIRHRVDHSSHLHQIGGFLAMRPDGPVPSNDSPAIQAICYCTDKNLWRKRGDERGVFRASHCRDATTKRFPDLIRRLDYVTSVLAEASAFRVEDSLEDAEVTLPDAVHGGAASARWELRVGIQHAVDSHWNIHDVNSFAEMALVAYEPSVWW
jgi:hypothetical protein